MPFADALRSRIQSATWQSIGAAAANGTSPWGTIPGIGSTANFIWHDRLADGSASDSGYAIYRTKKPVVACDLDVDSDNSGTLDRSASEEGIEADAARPGVIIPVGGNRAKLVVQALAGQAASLALNSEAARQMKVYPQATGGTALEFKPFGTNPVPTLDMAGVQGGVVTGATTTWTLWVEATAPSVSLADIVFTLTANGGLSSTDIVRATAMAMPAVDIDVDSNNNGSIGEDDDPIEDTDPGDYAIVGARIFQNIDDDDRNGSMDKADGQFKPGVEDLDLAEALLRTSGLRALNSSPLKKDGIYRLWLGVPAGLNVFADRRRAPLTPDGTDGTWRYWNVAPDGASTFPSKVFIEGLVVGEYEVLWQLCEPNAPGQNGPPQQSVARDVVDISVEEMVFPTSDQHDPDAYSKNTSQWDGFALKEEYPWIIEKPLVDFIKARSPVGWLETPYRQPPASGEANAPSLESRQTANNGSFTIEFEFEYDRSRGESGWVAANGQQKISFVANSGVKFGTDFSTEIALLDVRAMVDRATITTNNVTYTGLDAFDPSKGGGIVVDDMSGEGKVDFPDLTGSEREEIARLLTGVAYNRDYVGVTDAPNMPPIKADRQADDYFRVLKAVYDRAGDTAGGSLKANYAGATSTLAIWLNGQQTYVRNTTDSDFKPVGAVDTLQLQSHWGSGVRFKNIKISD